MQSDSFVENIKGNNVEFKIWDTAGADKYYDEVVKFTQGANLVAIVHDISKPFDGSGSSYLQKIYTDIHSKIQFDGKIILVGSKYDKRHDAIIDATNQVSLLKSVAKTIPCARIITSAKENEGIQNLKKFIIESSKDMQLYRQDPDNGIGVKAFEIRSGGFCTLL